MYSGFYVTLPECTAKFSRQSIQRCHIWRALAFHWLTRDLYLDLPQFISISSVFRRKRRIRTEAESRSLWLMIRKKIYENSLRERERIIWPVRISHVIWMIEPVRVPPEGLVTCFQCLNWLNLTNWIFICFICSFREGDQTVVSWNNFRLIFFSYVNAPTCLLGRDVAPLIGHLMRQSRAGNTSKGKTLAERKKAEWRANGKRETDEKKKGETVKID